MTRSHSRRTWPQRLVIGLNLLAIVGCLLAVAALVYGYRRVSRIARVELGDVLTSGAGLDQTAGAGSGPENFLIVGTDSGERLDPDDPAGIGRPGGIRSDSIMILRVDPGTGQAALLSLPRDLWVPIAGTGGSQRINTAVNQGGPELLVRTIQGALSIPVHHYVEVDFRGFYDLVDAIGGVPVYFPEPVRDNLSGLDIPEPGCVALDPAMALAYVRARNYEAYRNGRWRTDPSADLGRITRQQDFVRRALQRAIDRGARNPVVLDNLLDAAVGNLTIDDQLTLGDLVDLARRFRNFSPENLETYSVPVDNAVIGAAKVLRMRQSEARPILDRFRGVEAGVLTPASVLVTVQNGTGEPGAAGRVADDLRAVGFTVPEGGAKDADRFDYERTTVVVPAGLEDQADLILQSLAAGAEVVDAADEDELTGIVVIVGRDYAGAVTPPVPEPAVPEPAVPEPAVPEPVVPEPAAEDPAVPAPTTTSSPVASDPTTTVVGEVPVTPPDAGC